MFQFKSRKWAGWVVALCVLVQFFLLFGPLYNYSILFVSFREEFHTSAALTGGIGSLQYGLVSFFSPLGGVFRKWLSHRSVCMLAVTVFSLGCLTTSFVPNIYWAFLTVGVMMSFGAGANMHSGLCLLFEWYPGKNNARATCLALLGTSIGFLAFAPLKTRLIVSYGWRNMMRIIGGGVFVLGILSALLLVPPPAPEQRSKKEDTESPVGDTCVDESQPDRSQGTADKATDPFSCEEMDGEKKQDGGQDVDVATATSAIPDLTNAEKNEESTADDEAHKKGFLEIIRQVDIWLYMGSQTFAMTGWAFVTINFASFMKNLGFTVDQTSLAIIVFGVAEVFGKILVVLFGDHLPFLQVNMVAMSSVFGAMVAGFLTIATSLTDIIILSVAGGVLRSIYLGIAFSASYQLFGAYGGDVVTSIVLIPFGLGPIIGAQVTGFLFDISGDYTFSLLVLVGMFVLSVLCVLMITLRRNITIVALCKRTVTAGNYNLAHHVQTDGDNQLNVSGAENKRICPD